MKLINEHKGDRVEFEVHEHATLDEVLHKMKLFLIACEYYVPLDAQLELVEEPDYD